MSSPRNCQSEKALGEFDTDRHRKLIRKNREDVDGEC